MALLGRKWGTSRSETKIQQLKQQDLLNMRGQEKVDKMVKLVWTSTDHS